MLSITEARMVMEDIFNEITLSYHLAIVCALTQCLTVQEDA